MTGSMLREAAITSSKQLYKYLLRQCDKLPKGANEFYKHSIRQSFKQHIVEPDSERVQQIMEKALADAKWVLQKYGKEAGDKTVPPQ